MILYNYDKNKNVIEEIKSCEYVELDGRTTSYNTIRYTYAYDKMGRQTEKKENSAVLLRYFYDRNGNLVGQQDISGKYTKYVLDAAGRIDQVLDNEQIVAFYIYNADGTIKNLSYGNGVQTHYEYDGNKNIAKLTTRFSSGNVLTDNAYFYDNNGNQVQKTENGVATTYQYDPINQIQKVVYNRDTERQKVEEFVYDAAGNRVERTIDNAKEAYYYDKKNRLTKLQSQLQGTISFEYDDQGNTLREVSDTGTKEYGYDIYNRTVGVKTADGHSIRNVYDPIGLRAKVERDDGQSKFVFSGWSIVAELDSEFNVRAREVRGYSLLEKNADGQKYYYHHNEHGDVTALTDVAEEIRNSYSYDVFGNNYYSTEVVGNQFLYAGEQYSGELGLYYLRARYYCPTLGRFTQEDVYRGSGLNLYTYVLNNPQILIDPSGYAHRPVSFINSPDLFPVKEGQSNVVTITMTGDRDSDFTAAFKEARIKRTDAKGYTWHHEYDFDIVSGITTMSLVDTDTHKESVPHAGSVSQFEKELNVEYGTFEAKQTSYEHGWREKEPQQRKTQAQGCPKIHD